MENSRFKDKKDIGVIVAVRGAESFDRYTVLKQGDYNNGRYGTQYDCGVFSPFMDLSTEDLWKINAALDFDTNEIYSMMWEAGVPLGLQRIGSPINSHSKDAVKLYKVLNPTTYGKMIGRVNTIDFTASYGGVFSQGFKYIKLDQPKPFYEGIVTADSLIDALNYLGVEYFIRTTGVNTSKEAKTIHNTKDEPVTSGMNIRLNKIFDKYIRQLAADKALEEGNKKKAEYYIEHLPKAKTWYDYLIQLVNEAEPMYQKSWMPKFETSIKHWAKEGSCVNESTIIALRVLGGRVNKDFGLDRNDYEEFVDWAMVGFTDISRKPILKYFRYNMDCAENLVRAYVYDILDNWENGGKEEFYNNKYLYNLIMIDGSEPLISKVIPAFINFVESPTPNDIHQCFIDHCTFENSEKKQDRWEFSKREGKVLVTRDEIKSEFFYKDAGIGKRFDDCSDEEKENRIKSVLASVAHKYWHDAVRESANWKRCVIACLRNDIKLTYLQFGQSSEEKMIRANAEAAFAKNEEERQKKIKELEQLKAKMSKEEK